VARWFKKGLKISVPLFPFFFFFIQNEQRKKDVQVSFKCWSEVRFYELMPKTAGD
jgi:hypothetical protein